MNNNRLTSIALFSKLYDNEHRDVFHIVSEFLKATLVDNSMRVFDSVQLKAKLQETFSINLPDAIIRTVLRNRLREVVVRQEGGNKGQYISNITSDATAGFQEKANQQSKEYHIVFETLYSFLSQQRSCQLPNEEKETIKALFIQFLLGESNGDENYTALFNAFIIVYQREEMISRLNTIKEGLILYSGIQYSDSGDLNNLGTWKSPMVIYLDTEHLFNLAGLNGELLQDIFFDFFNLVKEINAANKTGRLIELRYWRETKDIVDGFFKEAERVVDGRSTPNPAKTALINILEECVDCSDVQAKKSQFYTTLQAQGVQLDESDIDIGEWRIDNEDIFNRICSDLGQKGWMFNENEIYRYLNYYSRINSLRNGINSVGFEKSRYVMLSENSIAHYIAHHEAVKREKAVPFATNIDFITSRMWFRLKKSFANGSAPKAFDIIARSQVVLSAQINDSVYPKYEQLKSKKYSPEEQQNLYNDLRLNVMHPKQITFDTIPGVMTFLSHSDIESLRNERTFYQERAKKNAGLELQVGETTKQYESELKKREQAEAELIRYKREKRTEILKLHKKQIRKKLNIIHFLLFFVFAMLLIGGVYGLSFVFSPEDTIFSIICGTIGLGALLWPIFKQIRRRIGESCRKTVVQQYIDTVSNHLDDSH